MKLTLKLEPRPFAAPCRLSSLSLSLLVPPAGAAYLIARWISCRARD